MRDKKALHIPNHPKAIVNPDAPKNQIEAIQKQSGSKLPDCLIPDQLIPFIFQTSSVCAT
jgi:hypothetical protein